MNAHFCGLFKYNVYMQRPSVSLARIRIISRFKFPVNQQQLMLHDNIGVFLEL